MPKPKRDPSESDRTRQVVNHIKDLLERGILRPGDKIPPERELARALKISRASLRTGIGYLAAMGVMNIRHGVGTFIHDGPAEFSKASLSFMSTLHGFQPWQMFEARRIIESSLAAMAAERANDEHHVLLAEQVAEMFSIADDPEEFLKHDVQFHRTIAQASGNPILAALIETITSAMYEDRLKTVSRARYLRKMAEMHRDIYRAIRAHDPAEAQLQMQKHLQVAEDEQKSEVALPRPHPVRTNHQKRAATPEPGKPTEAGAADTSADAKSLGSIH
jgi:GntR family transcriptional repressor for pyruvate dehydrogenase complex